MPRLRTPIHAGLLLPRAQQLLRPLVVVAVLFALAAPSFAGGVAPRLAESKSPVESEEETQGRTEEGLAGSQRLRFLPGHGKVAANAPRAFPARRPFPSSPLHRLDGHRLTNGLLAPLTC